MRSDVKYIILSLTSPSREPLVDTLADNLACNQLNLAAHTLDPVSPSQDLSGSSSKFLSYIEEVRRDPKWRLLNEATSRGQ